ncbi:hypothetical protein NDU88_003990 [Pleurodeles waltl]|uniref:Uncharacterized protein n=1 Tax=Pleurodeles waltl TaxID=8319 RepID=A0AAV7KX41_PLEWA|nr:hypothetical protein NDU88_003990 [Pleurodeles waltl]
MAAPQGQKVRTWRKTPGPGVEREPTSEWREEAEDCNCLAGPAGRLMRLRRERRGEALEWKSRLVFLL